MFGHTPTHSHTFLFKNLSCELYVDIRPSLVSMCNRACAAARCFELLVGAQCKCNRILITHSEQELEAASPQVLSPRSESSPVASSANSSSNTLSPLSSSQRDRYVTLSAMYVWSAILGLPYVPNRPVYRYSRSLFMLFNHKLYRCFLTVVSVAHVLLTIWEPASER